MLESDITTLREKLGEMLSDRQKQAQDLMGRSLFEKDNDLISILVQVELLRHTIAMLEMGDLRCHLLNLVDGQ
jgi:hypothetical protein